jgi:hypothetical protein
MAEVIKLDPYRSQPLPAPDGAPVAEIPGLIYWQGCPVPAEAWDELSDPYTNGWLAA